MANTLMCGDCVHFNSIKKALRKKEGGIKELAMGHCLIKTVYASNKPGNPVYPPRAKTAELPYGRHNVCVVKSTEIVPGCSDAKRR